MTTTEITSVATVFYGGVTVLEKTLPTWLSSFGSLGLHFSFVDNTAGDEVKNLLSVLGFFDYQNTTYQKQEENIGFAEGANRAIKNASTNRIFLLNPDTYFDKTLAEQIASEQLTIEQPFVAFGLNTAGTVHTGIAINNFGFFVDSINNSDLVIGPSGGAMLFHKDQFLNLGGFAQQLFAWGEDAELALRLYAKGIKTRKSEIQIRHVGGHTVASGAGAKLKAKLINRNRILILRATYSVPAQIVWVPVMLVAVLANMVLRAERRRTIIDSLSGVREGFREPLTFAWNTEQRLGLSTINRLCWGTRNEE
jgi:GT2 family glycosyltransferase